jgi:hypothetical protein
MCSRTQNCPHLGRNVQIWWADLGRKWLGAVCQAQALDGGAGELPGVVFLAGPAAFQLDAFAQFGFVVCQLNTANRGRNATAPHPIHP